MKHRRVVITGLGAVTPIGNDVESFWTGIKEGKTGFAPITAFDTTDYKVKIAAEVKDYDPLQTIDKKSAKRMERFSQFAVTAAGEAIKNAGLDMGAVLKTTVFLSDMNNFGAMNGVYAEFFPEGSYPARSAVQVARLPKDALVEIELIAAR